MATSGSGARATESVILVLAAWEPELERFHSLAGQARLSASTSCARVVVAAAGIGLVDAAIGTSVALSIHAPSRVVLLGTCGASPASGLAIEDVITGTSVRLVDAAVVEGRAAMPFANDPLVLASSLGDVPLAGARAATIANTVGVTTDDRLAAELASYGDVEHLEAYGVARACQLAGVPCTVLLAVANVVGARGREAWRANHVAASARAAEIAWAALERL